jgi:hypothetical protein
MGLKETVEGCRLDASGSGQGTVVACYKYDNEPSGSIKRGEFLSS